MNDKKMLLIQAAIKLFGERDYHSASIQDIVSLAGVSKGSFYLHFHSKEELLLSIFKHYFSSYFTQLEQACQDQALTKKELLIKAIALQCELVMENKDFLTMQVKGIVSSQSEQIQQICMEQSLMGLTWFQTKIIDLYGPAVEPHGIDLATMLNGMLKEYFFCYICFNHPIDIEKLSVYLIERLDDLVHGLLGKHQEPILSSKYIFQETEASAGESRLTCLTQLKQGIETYVTDPKSAQSMLLALQALETEFLKEHPNDVIIQGMYTYLQSLSGPYPQLADMIENDAANSLCKGLTRP
ncbi:TetR family transcriptional regulator [Paenibacillus rigui]|uniref:HTH tetR-type domain-containing protein n=1 Tax=Paenibacillus rigui TaxID=554312 RepID=A0A229UUQ1_9BACL|nr:TetR family transcriptional regulator [Paenibacillus rigui]OXM87256.1 hypothetical protein CF651_06345 [Paenibacillus rigui]